MGDFTVMNESEVDDYNKYKAVNATKSLEELAQVIESFADDDGKIQGRSKKFNAKTMAETCRNYKLHNYPNFLTRNWGIRQQAMMLNYYE